MRMEDDVDDLHGPGGSAVVEVVPFCGGIVFNSGFRNILFATIPFMTEHYLFECFFNFVVQTVYH